MSLSMVMVVGVVSATLLIGLYGVRLARTTSDFFVATRSVGPWWNASAIAGEYLSAASFLGIAGLVMKSGASVMWYPVGYAAGYLVLLLFVAAPLRRFGAYTIPDFAEARFASPPLRTVAAVLVLVIGWFYLLPQMKGAGVTLQLLLGTPYWVGVVVVGFIVTLAVTLGGMKGVTYVQAFHYWTELVAISFPAVVLAGTLGLVVDGGRAPFGDRLPTFPRDTTVTFRADTTVNVAVPLGVEIGGRQVTWPLGVREVAGGTAVTFRRGDPVPTAAGIALQDGFSWTLPFPDQSGRSLVAALSLLLATVLGTMGLPHILVRFYTNRDASSARRTSVGTLALVGGFYFFPWMYAVLGRVWTPELYVTGDTEVVVLTVPRLLGGAWGEVLAALVAAGAFSAFLSTSSGLMVSVAGALSHDLAGPVFRSTAGDRRRLWYFRGAAALAGVVAVALGMLVRSFDINVLVGWVFAIAASAFCPLLLLGIWWRRLTRQAAGWGMVTGGLASTLAILVTMLAPQRGWAGTLLAQPAIVTVPLAFVVMIWISRRTRPPRQAERILLQMHAPDRVSQRMSLAES